MCGSSTGFDMITMWRCIQDLRDPNACVIRSLEYAPSAFARWWCTAARSRSTMALEAQITVRKLTDFATGEKTPLRVLLVRDKAKELSAIVNAMNVDAKSAVCQLGCTSVAVTITTLFHEGKPLSEDRVLGFHRAPEYHTDLAEGSHLDVVSNPEVFACLQAINQELHFADKNMVYQDGGRTCPRCGAESTEPLRQDFDDLQRWKFCPKPWGHSPEGGRCGFPLLTNGNPFNRNKGEVRPDPCALCHLRACGEAHSSPPRRRSRPRSAGATSPGGTRRRTRRRRGCPAAT